MQKYKEFKNYATKFGKSDDMGENFKNTMKTALKSRFIEGMSKIAIKVKEYTLQNVIKVQTVEQSVQTDKIQNTYKGKNKNDDKRFIEKYLLEIEALKKVQTNLIKDLDQVNHKLKES